MILFRAINSGIFFMCIILLLNKQTNKQTVINSFNKTLYSSSPSFTNCVAICIHYISYHCAR